MTYSELYETIFSAVKESFLLFVNKNEIDDYIKECESRTYLILEYFTRCNKYDFLNKKNEILDLDIEIDPLINNIKKGMPIQYITGKQCFYGYDFTVTEDVLIPRFDTEVLVEWIISREKNCGNNKRILDMCTGSGCIIISLLKKLKNIEGVGADISVKALEVAKLNAANLDADVQFIKSDLFENVNEKFDIIVSNPPYIESDVIPSLSTEVREFEPMIALDGGKDGLMFYRRIAKEGIRHLNKGGALYFEIGYNEGQSVIDILKENGYHGIELKKDLAGLDRCVMGLI